LPFEEFMLVVRSLDTLQRLFQLSVFDHAMIMP
jgi:hypothetical protein